MHESSKLLVDERVKVSFTGHKKAGTIESTGSEVKRLISSYLER